VKGKKKESNSLYKTGKKMEIVYNACFKNKGGNRKWGKRQGERGIKL